MRETALLLYWFAMRGRRIPEKRVLATEDLLTLAACTEWAALRGQIERDLARDYGATCGF